MEKKTQYVIGFVFLGFFMPVGIPYFYLNRFTMGFVFLFVQVMMFSVFITYADFQGLWLVDTAMNESFLSEVMASGDSSMITYDKLYILFVFFPGTAQAIHISILKLQKKI